MVDFVYTKPPSVMFMVCLTAFGVATLGLSFYFSWATEIPNPDAINWNTLLIETGSLYFCLDKHRGPDPAFNESKSNLRNVSISVSLSDSWFDEYFESLVEYVGKEDVLIASGRILFKDMGRKLPHRFKTEEIKVTFEIPLKLTNPTQTMCVNMEAPLHVLQEMNSAPSLPENCSLPTVPESSTISLSSISGDHLPPKFCDKGLIFQLPFETRPTWTVLIDGQDQAMIHMHLMVMSAFLFVLVGLLVTFIFVRGIFCKRNSSHSQLKDIETLTLSDSDSR